MGQLLLLTFGYPYGNGETFIENEIPYLSKSFSKILIVAVGDETTFCSKSRLPSNCYNVEVLACQLPHNNKKYLFYSLKHILTISPFNKPYSSMMQLGRLRYSFKKTKKQIYRFLSNEPTILYSYWLTLSPFLTYIRNGKNVAKKISRTHGYDLYSEMHPWGFEFTKKHCLKKLDEIYPCSLKGRNYLLEKYNNIVKNKIFVSRLGTSDCGLANQSYNKNNIVFITCSNNAPVKNIPFFAKAFSLLLKTNKSLKWVCIGFKPNKDIIDIINENHTCNNCFFLGKLENKDVLEYYKNNYVSYFVNVSKSEGIPVSIMEAQSFGIPVIASNVGGTGEIVNNDNGFLFDTNISVDEFVNLLKKAINISKDNYQLKRQLSRITWEAKASADKNYPEFIKMIKH